MRRSTSVTLQFLIISAFLFGGIGGDNYKNYTLQAEAVDKADIADTDVGCRSVESLAKFQDYVVNNLGAGVEVGEVYEKVMGIDPAMKYACTIDDITAFTVVRDLGDGFSEATLAQDDGTDMVVVISTPAMDTVDESEMPTFVADAEGTSDDFAAAVIASDVTCDTASAAADSTTPNQGECQ